MGAVVHSPNSILLPIAIMSAEGTPLSGLNKGVPMPMQNYGRVYQCLVGANVVSISVFVLQSVSVCCNWTVLPDLRTALGCLMRCCCTSQLCHQVWRLHGTATTGWCHIYWLPWWGRCTLTSECDLWSSWGTLSSFMYLALQCRFRWLISQAGWTNAITNILILVCG